MFLVLLSLFLHTSSADVGVFVFHVHRGDSGSEYRKAFDEILSQVAGSNAKPDTTSEFRAFPFHFMEYAEKRIEELAYGLGKNLEGLHPYYLPLGGSSPVVISTLNSTVYGVQPMISSQMMDHILGGLYRSGFHAIEPNPARGGSIAEFAKDEEPAYLNLIIVDRTPLAHHFPDWKTKRIGLTHVRLNQYFDIYRCKTHWTDEKCEKVKTECIGRGPCSFLRTISPGTMCVLQVNKCVQLFTFPFLLVVASGSLSILSDGERFLLIPLVSTNDSTRSESPSKPDWSPCDGYDLLRCLVPQNPGSYLSLKDGFSSSEDSSTKKTPAHARLRIRPTVYSRLLKSICKEITRFKRVHQGKSVMEISKRA
ncbi:hypothetical protein PRIPAC_89213 [Pristionchus pacificus]|uniref:Uncharacterized protein n=1 Tax=Pristionchus pacificus TaxID=54126 RepID=A0A2A6B6C0_PRIPA|nr:hypothetical protein PRIPAC_89213 [Pristionchus pacificus]|eukprot:PDM61426.1 hypothetical protein PRIPAC_50868 [Pristionchus pacificus]